MAFKDLKKDSSIQNDSDNIPLAGGLFDTGIYSAIIDVAYMITAPQKGTQGVVLHFKIGDRTFRNTQWICTADGTYTWKSGDRSGYWPGFVIVDEICSIVTGQDLENLPEPENKVLSIWNSQAKKEMPTEVPVMMNLQGGMLEVGIHRTMEDHWIEEHKTKWIEKNELVKVFHTDGLTVNEKASSAVNSATKIKWEMRYGNGLIDKRKASAGGEKYIRESTTLAGGKVTEPSKSLFTE